MMIDNKQALIFGATGNIGGAATRELLTRGWKVRAVTRKPESEKALALDKLGAEVVHGDMEDRSSLDRVFQGMERVLSVQNWVKGGVEAEVRQGKLVADAARAAQVKHLVYASAGAGEPQSGVPHFDCKLEVEAHMRMLGLPFTILRPAPFMELLTEKEFFPPLSVWGAQIKILGWDTPIPWVAAHDIGVAVVNILENPDSAIGQDISLFGDVKTMRECRAIFKEVDGKPPAGVPLPLWLFKKMAGEEFLSMWRWLLQKVKTGGPEALWQTVEVARQINPNMLDVRSWLMKKRKEGAV